MDANFLSATAPKSFRLKNREGESNRKHRRHPRRPLNRQVRFAVDNTILDGYAVDISPSGVFVKSGKRVRTGQIITLRVLDKTGKDVFVQGKVVWSNVDGFGLKFIVK